MKKRIVVLSLILSVVLVASLVSALSAYDLRNAGEQIIEWIKNIFTPFLKILVGVDSVNEHFFARVLLLILLYIVILSILRKIRIFRDKPFVYILISAIVSILSIRYLSTYELIDFILIPYGALGVAATVFLPFLIYFYFVHDSVPGSTGRRAAWILFAAVFFGFWIARRTDLKEFNWIYLLGIAAVGISFIFDGYVHKYFEIGKFKKAETSADVSNLANVEKRIQGIKDTWGANPDEYSGKVYETYLRLEDERDKLRKKLSM